ncbi:hypothetical protein ACX1H4_21635 [Yersinia enterocolitica]|uniref:hypothetical protein n=1 Tax=Yersinia enterocolitica TaxID=630 RepID=UPI0030D02894|nr:hypothetical protein [Yersinia enterocolitica]
MNEHTPDIESLTDVKAIFLEFGDTDESIEILHKSSSPICSELGGCHLLSADY